eukprot:jgi/Mesen1/7397/ME000388S06610
MTLTWPKRGSGFMGTSIPEDDIEESESPNVAIKASRILGPVQLNDDMVTKGRHANNSINGTASKQELPRPSLESFAYNSKKRTAQELTNASDAELTSQLKLQNLRAGTERPSTSNRPIELADDDDRSLEIVPKVSSVNSSADNQKPKRRRLVKKDLLVRGGEGGELDTVISTKRTLEEGDTNDYDATLLGEGGTSGQTNGSDGPRGRGQNGQSVEGYGKGHRKGRVIELDDFESEEEDGEGTTNEDNPVFAALKRCEKVAAALKKELHAAASSGARETSSSGSQLVEETDSSRSKLVSQADVAEACGNGDMMLKPYQLVGVNFLLLLHRRGVGGAILADEMGLGKTAQAIAFLATLAHLDDNQGPHLVVVPASLLDNWRRELQLWCPAFDVVLYHGNERAQVRKGLEDAARRHHGAAPFNVLLTTYSFFERDSLTQKADRAFLKAWDFSCVLMDEAHLLKDRNSSRELWSLLEFLMPDIFASSKEDVGSFLREGMAAGAGAAGGGEGGGDLIARIKGIMGPFVLRRVKADVMQQLVPKAQRVRLLEMEGDQARAYKEAVEKYRRTVEARSQAKADKDGDAAGSGANLADLLPRRQVANIFVHLRKVANHPLLIRRLYTDEAVKDMARALHQQGAFGHECTQERVLEEIREYNDFSLHQLCMTYSGPSLEPRRLTDDHVMASAKCKALGKLLKKLRRHGHRPLIFSQWTAMLDILGWALKILGYKYVRLDGSTQVTERQVLVDEYNNNTDVFAFLLSTRAGGQGLNLTGADTVILHDVDFNPQVDRQAEDRCHRIGQEKPVTVYRLVAKDTVDESILKIAQRKLSLDAAVLDSSVDCRPAADEDETRTMGDILSSLLNAQEV